MAEVDVDEFIGDILEHKAEYDPRKRREYYLRTRKLKGKNGEQGVPRKKSQNESEQRRQVAAEKVQRAREKAKNLNPSKRRQAEKKLDELEKKLGRLNPFGKKDKKPDMKYTKSSPVSSSQRDADRREVISKRERDRVRAAEKRVKAAREQAKKLKGAERRRAEGKLKALEIGINLARKGKIKPKNPFKGAKIDGPKNPLRKPKVTKKPDVRKTARKKVIDLIDRFD